MSFRPARLQVYAKDQEWRRPIKLDNEPDRWGIVARVLHWIVAALVVTMLVLGWASELEEERNRSFMLIRTHFQFGVILFGLMILRLSWRLARPDPRPAPPVEDETLRAGAWYVHYFSGWILIGLTVLHIAAAGWHQFVARDRLLDRMLT